VALILKGVFNLKYLVRKRDPLVEVHVRMPEEMRKKIVAASKRKKQSINRYLVELIFSVMVSDAMAEAPKK
jgi:hypothetical protein